MKPALHPVSGVVAGEARKAISYQLTRATDPGWSPLFINAGRIILEIGGALLHGAFVAREYGIPCVSVLDSANSELKDGQWVEVDGTNGIVRVLEEDEELQQP